MAAISEDLPALGKPTRPTSATLFSSRTTSWVSPGSPSSANPGALRRVEASAALPSPPRPPWAATNRLPAPVRSASTSPSAPSDDRAVRYAQFEVGAVGAVAVAARALLAVAGALVRVVVEVEQGVHVLVDDEHDIAAAAAVTAVRAAERLELLAVDRGDAVAAVAGGEVQHDAVDEARHAAPL